MNPPDPGPTDRRHSELDRVPAAEESQLASLRRDASLGDSVTNRVVREAPTFTCGPSTPPPPPGFAAHLLRYEARVWTGSVEKDVSSEDADHALDDQIDAADRRKHRRYAAGDHGPDQRRPGASQDRDTGPPTETPVNKEKES
jgi:hypothetical protein